MNYKERELREKRARKSSKMAAFAGKLEDSTITHAERAEFDKLSREVHDLDRRIEVEQRSDSPEYPDTRGYAETPTDRDAVLRAEHRYSAWLQANWNRDEVRQGAGSWPNQWDAESTRKYWRGMCTGNWSNASAEQRAAMAEGTNATGGYLVPAPVAGNAIDLLRDALVFTKGMSHTVPWVRESSGQPALSSLSKAVLLTGRLRRRLRVMITLIRLSRLRAPRSLIPI